MPVVSLSASQYARWVNRLAADFPQMMQTAATSGAMACIPVVIKATDTSPPPSGVGGDGAVDTGRFRKSWKAGKHPEGAWVYNDAPYAAVIEHGRRKGARMPPPKALIAWCKRKAKADDPRSMAYVLARAIKRRGIRARKIMRRSLAEMRRMFDLEVRRVLEARYSKP